MFVSPNFAAAVSGFLLGATLIIAIGAQNAFILRQGLLRRHVFVLCLICALSDALLIAAGVGGFGALVAANPVGSVFMADGETFHAWPYEIGEEFGGRNAPLQREDPEPFPEKSRLHRRGQPGANTTIAIVATNANLSNVETKRIAMMAHDGIARAVRPAHTAFDGDIVFAVATAKQDLPSDPPPLRHGLVARIGAAAADCLTRAIARAVFEATR